MNYDIVCAYNMWIFSFYDTLFWKFTKLGSSVYPAPHFFTAVEKFLLFIRSFFNIRKSFEEEKLFFFSSGSFFNIRKSFEEEKLLFFSSEVSSTSERALKRRNSSAAVENCWLESSHDGKAFAWTLPGSNKYISITYTLSFSKSCIYLLSIDV